MENRKIMLHCDTCDVYVGESDDGRLVVVTGELLRKYIAWYGRFSETTYCSGNWEGDAQAQRRSDIWLEPDDVERGWWWYRARGLDELHDHWLWLALVNARGDVNNLLPFPEQQFLLFVRYVSQFPDLRVQAEFDTNLVLSQCAQLEGSVSLTSEEVVASRDASFRLCGVADGAGLRDVASFFYGCYEMLFQYQV